mmetsp:Transcript_50831/g.145934  ORF Transcript_50831/g.145934 Transcript_50831/m.145934 type:complete len:549 (-) Transcript_50831:82-1728(-)
MQRAWLREFNALGLQLRPQAAKLVTEFLSLYEDPTQMAETLVEYTKNYLRSRQGRVEAFIDADTIRSVLECMHQVSAAGSAGSTQEATRQGIEALDLGDGIQIYDVTSEVAPFDYRTTTKEWAPALEPSTLFPGPDVKAKIYGSRYHLLLQRTLLEGKYVIDEEASATGILPGQLILTKVESLQGNPGPKTTFGLLARVQSEGKRQWTIEDLHKVYPVELEVQESDHLMTDGSFVLAEGRLEGGRFLIKNLDLPGAVPRNMTLVKDLIPRQTFGGTLTDAQLKILEESEPGNPDGFYVVLSEVHLDSGRVLEKLTDLFQGYEESQPPTAYVLMGSFCSSPFVTTAEGIRSYRDGFERLKFMLRGLSNHIQSGTRFVFVPGPNDPGAQMLPHVALPEYLTSDLAKDVPNVVMGTNPCRLRHFSRELVFFRHDVLRLLRRHEVVPLREPDGGPASAAHARTEMVRFLLDQAHLVPLPLEQSNILWAYDHTLRLYPLPHAVFIGGVTQPFDTSYAECKFCSVGPFSREAEFYAFHPVKDLMEQCGVPDRAG